MQERTMDKTTFTEEQNEYIAQNQLSPEALEESIQRVIARSIIKKTPSSNKIAFVVGGQPGSGKSGIIGNILTNFGSNYIVVDNDEYRNHHPNVAEINRVHPEIFTECTDQLSFKSTPRVIANAIDGGYNMVIHQTLKNDGIIKWSLTDLTNADYARVIVVMAADEKTSNEGMLRRCQGQIQTDGTCRWVPQENHDYAYNGLPSTVGKIEDMGIYDAIVVVMRSEDENKPNNVRVIYRVYNPNISPEHKKILEEAGFADSEFRAYGSAREAVEKGRELDAAETMAVLEGKLKEARSIATTPEEKVRIERLQKMYDEAQGGKQK